MPSIDYLGTQVYGGLFQYSSTKVLGQSARVSKLQPHFLTFSFNVKFDHIKFHFKHDWLN